MAVAAVCGSQEKAEEIQTNEKQWGHKRMGKRGKIKYQ